MIEQLSVVSFQFSVGKIFCHFAFEVTDYKPLTTAHRQLTTDH